MYATHSEWCVIVAIWRVSQDAARVAMDRSFRQRGACDNCRTRGAAHAVA